MDKAGNIFICPIGIVNSSIKLRQENIKAAASQIRSLSS